MKRGFNGTSRCILCKGVEESISHLLILCLFARTIWTQLLAQLNCYWKWEAGLVEEAASTWIAKIDKKLLTIPMRVLWGIWIHRNKATFE